MFHPWYQFERYLNQNVINSKVATMFKMVTMILVMNGYHFTYVVFIRTIRYFWTSNRYISHDVRPFHLLSAHQQYRYIMGNVASLAVSHVFDCVMDNIHAIYTAVMIQPSITLKQTKKELVKLMKMTSQRYETFRHGLFCDA